MNKKQVKRMLIVISIAIVLFIAALAIVIVLPLLKIDYICPTKEFLGIDCPGCGGTRMVQSILKGDIAQAFRYNIFMFITSPLLIILTIHQSLVYIIKGELSIWLDRVLIVYAISLLVFGILRNIEIFSWLKPTVI